MYTRSVAIWLKPIELLPQGALTVSVRSSALFRQGSLCQTEGNVARARLLYEEAHSKGEVNAASGSYAMIWAKW